MKTVLFLIALSAVATISIAAPETYIVNEKLYRLDHNTGRLSFSETRSATVVIDKELNTVKYISPTLTEYICTDPILGQASFSARFVVPRTAFVITGNYKAAKGSKLKGEYIWNHFGFYLKTKFRGLKAL